MKKVMMMVVIGLIAGSIVAGTNQMVFTESDPMFTNTVSILSDTNNSITNGYRIVDISPAVISNLLAEATNDFSVVK